MILAEILRDFVSNLRMTLGTLIFRRVDHAKVSTSLAQVVLAIAFALAIRLIFHVYWSSPISGIDSWGVASFAAHAFVFLATTTLMVAVFGWARHWPQFVIGLSFAAAIGGVASFAYSQAFMENWTRLHHIAALAAGYVPTVLFVIGAADGQFWPRLLRSFVFLISFIGLQFIASAYLPSVSVFTTDFGSENEPEAAYQPVDVERLYYRQDALLNAQIGALSAETPGRIDLFAVALAGTATQRVFMRETEAVGAILKDRYNPDGRVLQLANSYETPDKYPLANLPNLTAALAALAKAMDPVEDIALVFLTSHGNVNVFSLEFASAGTKNMSATQLAEALNASGLQNIIVVISACYSGSFIDELRSDDRIIIAAAAHDKTSFGCSDQNEWTWWGRAFFDNALRTDRDFRSAFETARALILGWEAEEDVAASDPQMFVGAAISVLLDEYLGQFDETATQAPAN